VPCSQCNAIEKQFDDREAQRQLRRLRRRGPARTTRLLIDAVRQALGNTAQRGLSLLDIGAGIGASVVVGTGLLFVQGLCETGDGCLGDSAAVTLLGTFAGGSVGGVVGGLIGYTGHTWKRRHPR
jgi:hypothetical protein